jgi:hypothetical protein
LVQSLKSETACCDAAAQILAFLGKSAESALPDLERKWKTAAEDAPYRTDVAIALVRVSPAPKELASLVVPYLEREFRRLHLYLDDNDDELVRIAHTLGEIGPGAREALPPLENAARDRDHPKPREAAAAAVKRIRK